MKNIVFLFLLCGCIIVAQAQKGKSEQEKEPKGHYYDGSYDESEWKKRDKTWKRSGFELFIGGGIYFGGKKTANYYNGAPENNINLNLLLNNKYHREDVLVIMRRAYPYIGDIKLREDYNYNSTYDIAMDIALGAKYRIDRNWYLELSYSFRRLTVSNFFIFDFPGVPAGNIEHPYNKNYSRPQGLVAKEDRHYIDFSVGYIFQAHNIVKPFISVGGMFTYVRINRFLAVIEDKPFDLMSIARYPDWIPGGMEMPNYRDWAGPGYGGSLTVGLKIAFNHLVSIDPVFQLSVASFGNSQNLPNFNTAMGFNYMAGIRLVMNDALFTRNRN
ncbi:MAG: hypothetical protein FWC34_11400 [Bacteroidetes bacterium]|nr:hypothetical protein [Bacteroidota bacterium]MCL2302219.1 hypothetical protein [Lentimicrobiaceae bacterium]MCL2302299.1 hypothetical protein [Lentimicrobiaceae bacterium]